MTNSFLRSTVLAVVAIVALAGCGGAAAPSTSDPAGTVSAALDTAETGGFAKLADYTCAAKKGDFASLFGGAGGDLSSLTAMGINANTLFDAIKVDFQDVKATETSKSGDKATVHVTGKTTITFDPAKMKEVFKQIMAANGQPTDDTTIDAAIAAMSSQMTQSQTLDEDVSMVQEGGKWLICE
jgi:hypothetical protein